MATNKNITMKQFNGTDYDTLYPKTIASQVDGVLLAQILVTTLPNTEVTASLNSKTVSAMSDSSGLAILEIPSYGIWTVSANFSGTSTSTDCEIKAVAQYELSLFPALESLNWDFISSISENGNAALFFSIGDKKTVAIDGVNYQVQIIGFNHDDKTAGGKAGITFQLVDCLNTTYQMNSSNTNVGGWKSSAMRSRMSEFLGQLNEDLQSVIKPVNKLEDGGTVPPTTETVSDKLFLLSEVEIFGSATSSVAGEGSQYDWYKAGNTKVKKVNGYANIWWERSPYRGGGTNGFCSVDSTGSAASGNALGSFGVSFGFCV